MPGRLLYDRSGVAWEVRCDGKRLTRRPWQGGVPVDVAACDTLDPSHVEVGMPPEGPALAIEGDTVALFSSRDRAIVVTRRGTTSLAGGRETMLLRCDHPRTSHLLNDRPDHWLEVGVDAQTGMLLLLAEHVGDHITRHAEAVNVSLDENIPDSAFKIHFSSDTRTIY